MGLPGHRRTSSHKRRRASHFALKASLFIICSNCGSPTQPHIACWNCGFYKGRQVLQTGKSLAGASVPSSSKKEDSSSKEEVVVKDESKPKKKSEIKKSSEK
jgi:large subunit ribosomal protein L32